MSLKLFFFFLFQELYFEEVSECQYIEKFIRILKDSKVSKNSSALNDIQSLFARFVRKDLFVKLSVKRFNSLFMKHIHKGLFNIFPNDWPRIT